jgi:hypothetical protein
VKIASTKVARRTSPILVGPNFFFKVQPQPIHFSNFIIVFFGPLSFADKLHLMKPLQLPLISSFTRRTYASAARPKKNLDGKGLLLTLEHVHQFSSKQFHLLTNGFQFLQKKKALNLWREIVRALNSTIFIILSIEGLA